MELLWKRLANLLSIKSLVTLIVMVVFAALAITGKIAADSVKDIVYIVVAFYFGTQHEKKG